jgi:glucosylglycerate phosphorylase
VTPEAHPVVPPAARARLRAHLEVLYGDEVEGTLERLCAALDQHLAGSAVAARPAALARRLDERDAVLITYADAVRAPGEPPLATLRRFLAEHLADTVTTVHLLPFSPATSDDGFSVADYDAVDPALGTWDDVAALAGEHRLMVDAVINHVSAAHPWFRAFLRDESPYRDYFVTVDPDTDLSLVVRPRTSPLTTAFETTAGTRHVWTTFSADQVDLDYANPAVLVDVVRAVLAYVARGASILRLDAVTYLWKEIGTTCVHHPRTHEIVKLLRSVLAIVAPHVLVVTETNVPHAENVAYFGDGHDEAHMVYNFALPPLVLHTFALGDGGALSAWAGSLRPPSDATCFFNFLASHDGIGVRPVETLLGADAIAALAERVRAHGGLVSERSNPDGTTSPYELNVSLFDAISDPSADEPISLQVDRFVCAHAIMLALAGVPGIYLHSLLGSRSHHQGVLETGRARAINREKLPHERLLRELGDASSLRSRVLARFRQLLRARGGSKAFHPSAPQRVLDAGRAVFALRRGHGLDAVTCLHNVTGHPVAVDGAAVGLAGRPLFELVSGRRVTVGDHRLRLAPYAAQWLAEAGAPPE